MNENMDLSGMKPEEAIEQSGIDIKNLPFDKIEKEFIDSVIKQGEEHGVDPTEIAILVGPYLTKRLGRTRHRIMAEIFSASGIFEPKIVKLMKVTTFDMMGHISTAFKEILKVEHQLHNDALQPDGAFWPTIEVVKEPIQYEEMRMFIQIEERTDDEMRTLKIELQDEFDAETHKHKLIIHVVNEGRQLRAYNLRKEFKM